VPVPAAAWLFVGGVMTLGVCARRVRRTGASTPTCRRLNV
jgi:hypothetical protein